MLTWSHWDIFEISLFQLKKYFVKIKLIFISQNATQCGGSNAMATYFQNFTYQALFGGLQKVAPVLVMVGVQKIYKC